eukprot:5608265-Pleurochrysis_carterae.AAC.1
MSVSGFAKIATGLAGAEAGWGLGAGAGVSVVASCISFASRRRCSRTCGVIAWSPSLRQSLRR